MNQINYQFFQLKFSTNSNKITSAREMIRCRNKKRPIQCPLRDRQIRHACDILHFRILNKLLSI